MIDALDLTALENLVQETVHELPEEFKSQIDNVDIHVEIWPSFEDLQSIRAHPGTILFGLYRGIPKTKRGLGYSAVLPDRITIFAGPIFSISKTVQQAKDTIRSTVLHEIGHFFGMSEEDIRKAERETRN